MSKFDITREAAVWFDLLGKINWIKRQGRQAAARLQDMLKRGRGRLANECYSISAIKQVLLKSATKQGAIQ